MSDFSVFFYILTSVSTAFKLAYSVTS